MREVGDRHGECTVLNDLAHTHRVSGDREQAFNLHRQALTLADRHDYIYRQAGAYTGLGHCLIDRDPAAARQHWQQALTIYRQIDVPQQNEVEAALRRCPEATR